MGRVALAFAAAAFAFPLFMLVSGTPDAWGGALRVGGVSVGAVLVLGVPAFALYRCRGWWQPWRFAAGGAAGGVACALVLLSRDAAHYWLVLVLFAAAGAAHAILFWFVAVWRNPALTLPRRYCLPGGKSYPVARTLLRRPPR